MPNSIEHKSKPRRKNILTGFDFLSLEVGLRSKIMLFSIDTRGLYFNQNITIVKQ